MNTKQLEELYLRHLNGEQLEEKEMAMVQEWLAKDKKNKDYLERLHKAAKANTLTEQFKSVDVDENWIRYKDTISRKSKEGIDHSLSQNLRPNLLRVAAVIILMAATAAIIYLLRSGQEYSIQQVSSVSQNTEIRLSDGSNVLLNRGSVLTYPKELHRRRREVELTGEAYFDIVRNEKTQFYVYMNDLAVQVLGTTFSIKETESGNTIVNVFSGKVAFYEKDNTNNLVQIEAGQKGIFSNNTGKFKQDWLDEDSTFFWEQGKLIFKNQSLAAVFKELEEVFSKSFIITDPEILRNKLTSKCEGLELDEILDEMSILFNIQYNIKGDTVYIQKDHE